MQLARSVLADETYLAIRTRLLEHSIQPGAHINIDALARELDVSQTPVRESLARLESDGLLAKVALRGYSATSLLTVSEVDDLFQFRLLIEPWAAGRAAELISSAARQRLDEEVSRGRDARSDDLKQAYAAMSEHDARFHELIAGLSESRFLQEALARTHCHLHLFRLYQASQTRAVTASDGSDLVDDLFGLYYQQDSGFLAFREHEAIAAAIAAGKADDARTLMQDHIESSRSRFSPPRPTVSALPAAARPPA